MARAFPSGALMGAAFFLSRFNVYVYVFRKKGVILNGLERKSNYYYTGRYRERDDVYGARKFRTVFYPIINSP